MNDIIPPKKRPLNPSAPAASRPLSQTPASPVVGTVAQQSIEADPAKKLLVSSKPKRRGLKVVIMSVLTLLVIGIVCAAAAYFWYEGELKPVSMASSQKVRVTIKPGTTPEEIANLLKQRNLIHSTAGFDWYTRLTGTSNILQAGTYSLSQNMSLPDIIAHLKSGKTDTFRITFLPGATIADDKKVLVKAGYTQNEVDAAFEKTYQHPLLATKPASADLEGYLYGETYEFASSTSVENILERAFDEMYKVVQANNLVAKYKKHNLSLYQGITLASIVQREVHGSTDQKLVAGIFYNRLKDGTSLGSDVTYQYIADKTGQTRSPDIDSPYNTRKYPGLPPGPIANPGEAALLAVGEPTTSDYLFFLSGDDDKTYYGRTLSEHERNVQQHCQQKCLIL